MINITEEIVQKHSEAEVIEYLYRKMSDVSKVLNEAVTEQNLMAIGSVIPIVDQSVLILKEIKKQNDLREAMKQ